MPNDIVVLNSQFMPLGKIGLEKAICLVYLGKAVSVKDSGKTIKSISGEIQIPLVLMMPNVSFVRTNNPPHPSRKNVFARDRHTCVYCGSQGQLTLDHVIPRDRWREISEKEGIHYKLNSWENLVAACRDCNSYKDNRLLSEIGWPQIRPKAPLMFLDFNWELLMED